MKRLFALIPLLVFCLLCAPGVLADPASDVPYLDKNGQKQTCPTATVVADSDTVWTSTTEAPGWYVVTGPVEIPRRVTVTGDVHLILADNASLTVNGGIGVAGGNALTIYAQSMDESTMGSLTATGSDSAGIGGGFNGSDGTLTIGPAADGKMLTVTAGDSETNAQEVPGSAFTLAENIIDKVSGQAWFRSVEVKREGPAPTGVTLNKTELSLFVGDSAPLTAKVAPEDAGNKDVTWTSALPR